MRATFVVLFASFVICLLGQQYSPKAGETVLKMEVEGRGNIYILLHTKEAPRTTAHILSLVRSGFYNSQRFHRVERLPKPFLVQIGDPTSKSGPIDNAGTAGSGARIPFEDTKFRNVVGAVGLVRNVDDKNSGDSQFYMLLDKSSFLDGNYTLFGQVVVGLDVLKRIQRGDRVLAVTVLKGVELEKNLSNGHGASEFPLAVSRSSLPLLASGARRDGTMPPRAAR